MEKLLLGIEIGGTKLQLVTGSRDLGIQNRRRFQVAPEKGGEGIREQISVALGEILPTTEIESVGVGFGGPVDWRTGRICCSHQIKGWSGVELGRWLHSIVPVPVRVDNDANVAALGEALRGAGQEFGSMFYVTLGSGVGGGFVSDRRIYHGASPGESEVGHLRLDRQGTILESRCSGWAVDKKIRQLKENRPESPLARMTREITSGEARFLGAALDAGDPEARRILEETAADLAFGLSHVVHLFHPEAVVLGGGLSLAGEPLRAAVSAALTGFVMEAFYPGPEIRLAGLGEDSVPVGALALALECVSTPSRNL
jgi:glucokinase